MYLQPSLDQWNPFLFKICERFVGIAFVNRESGDSESCYSNHAIPSSELSGFKKLIGCDSDSAILQASDSTLVLLSAEILAIPDL